MLLDIILLIYVASIALLVWLSETIPQFSFRILLIGLLLSPIAGFISYFYYQKQQKAHH